MTSKEYETLAKELEGELRDQIQDFLGRFPKKYGAHALPMIGSVLAGVLIDYSAHFKVTGYTTKEVCVQLIDAVIQCNAVEVAKISGEPEALN